ncbi:hypothetical protein [Streptomyces sp. MNP-20]|uniref:hypothetical protein n=1 Tax=Streptomyces sp. MNP-20 TaxID=2721165 RepID=UPI001554CC28|nr:hypothetical protein [Streptomyces sp. MNP-20]
MSAVRVERWRLAAVVLCVVGAVAAGMSAFVYARPLPALAVALGCFLIARYLRTQAPPPPAPRPDRDESGEAER